MHWVHYIPIGTTILAAYFFLEIYRHYRTKSSAKYLLWWMLGVLTYGMGTLAESINTVFGVMSWNVTYWYIVGALLGGFPLAQGTVYLLFKPRVAQVLTIIFVSLIIFASICVILSPVDTSMLADGRLSGKALTWQWVRYFSPFINLYSFIFLFGGAIYSAIKYYRDARNDVRFLGNVFIAIGALLPGIGGSFTRMGYVEVLYVTELLGLLSIYYGYRIIKNDRSTSIHQVQAATS
ncbi:MAG TPA: hypothetical protein P5275_02805 [Saprospiraceae bacterium]|nr:hypothetical protein [Saprospiraceae bacterium]MCB9271417.1 hypothetical protein [Lewinellaceae bacterium]HPG08850.1 hypothetical protein [Saprospiraceae bacterium]HQU53837.1 hypothetical protein [Saprospiraceae bacterium]HRV83758.1 hypothetical protein [Saprospiraceae bacterium]